MIEENKKLFNSFCKIHDKLIKNNSDNVSVGFLINKNNDIDVFPLIFNNQTEKEIMKESFKRKVLTSNTKAYILMHDAKITKISKNKLPVTSDCFIRILYTPQGKIVEICYYKNNKIIKKERPVEKVVDSGYDTWDVWSKSDKKISNKELNEYQDWKGKHPENYDGCI